MTDDEWWEAVEASINVIVTSAFSMGKTQMGAIASVKAIEDLNRLIDTPEKAKKVTERFNRVLLEAGAIDIVTALAGLEGEDGGKAGNG